MAKYSFIDLSKKKEGLTNILEKDKEYSFSLIYALTKSLNLINEELEDIRDSMPDDVDGFQEFQKKKIDLAEEHGAEVVRTQQGMRISNTENLDEDAFQEAVEKLEDEHTEMIEEQEEIAEKRNEMIQEKVAEIDWPEINPDMFPDSIKPDELPIEIIDLIKI